MNRQSSILLLLLLLAGTGTLVLVGWLQQPVSSQELLANFAKAHDFLAAAESVRGLPWWTPMFLQGTSLAFSWSFMVTNAVLLLFSIPLGYLAGPKIAAVVCLAFGAAGMHAFLKRYVADDRCALVGAALYLLSPSVLTRAAGYEHFVVICSMALLPWALWSLLGFIRNPSTGTAVGAALAYSAVVLAYGKTGVMALPVMVLFGLVEWLRQGRESRPGARLLAIASAAFLLLAVVPNLPALRETKFVAMFEFGPFEGWQHAFSTKSAMGWIDRDGILTRGTDSSYAPTTANGGTYLGLVVFAAFVIAFFRGTPHSSASGRQARLFLVFGLLMFWLSFGPTSVVGGQFAFLSMSYGAPDFSIAIAWFFVFAQVWMIFRLVPPDWPARRVIASAASIVYLFIPGFLLVEWLPIYRNIRAPFDFFQVTGVICVIVAAAVVIRLLFAEIHTPAIRSGLATAAILLACLDVSPYARPFFQEVMNPRVFGDFLATQEYLRDSKLPGRVYAFSGRYFYLLTPMLSHRPLVAEAFNSYLQQRGAAILHGAAFLSDENLTAFLNVAGISHVLVDKTDPDTAADFRERFSKLLPTGFENDNFVIFENKTSTGFGFLATDFLQATDDHPSVAAAALGGAKYEFATIELPGAGTSEPGLGGHIADGRIEAPSGKSLNPGKPFLNVSRLADGTYQRSRFGPVPADGWFVFNEAWHPDWRAFAGTRPVKVRKAFLGLSAVRVKTGEPVTFEFRPPVWYTLCAVVTIAAWLAAAVFLLMRSLLLDRWK